MIDDETGNLICNLITARVLRMKLATLKDRDQLQLSRGYP